MNNQRISVAHPFHMVEISPWPLLMAFAVLSLAFSLVSWMTLGEVNGFPIIIKNFLKIKVLWLRDIIREGKAGFHTKAVRKGIEIAFYLFLLSEVMIFFSIFWAYFHSSLNPSVEIVYWPPLGINAVDYLSLPLLNSLLLLGGGFVASGAHADLFRNKKAHALIGLIGCKLMTLTFLYIQFIEYSYSEFTINDSVYGSVFFAGTGTHGFHILCSILLMLVATYRLYTDSFTSEHSLVLDFALIYYHLVDVIWLFLFIVFYYWGS